METKEKHGPLEMSRPFSFPGGGGGGFLFCFFFPLFFLVAVVVVVVVGFAERERTRNESFFCFE